MARSRALRLLEATTEIRAMSPGKPIFKGVFPCVFVM